MQNNFNVEIISPEKIIFSDNVDSVTLPSYEGDMSILNNHISIITFLRPGIIKVQKTDGNFEEFFVQDGTVEYFNDSLVVLSDIKLCVNVSACLPSQPCFRFRFIENINSNIIFRWT